MHRLINPTESAKKLTQSVIQVTDMLGMYQAELARILHVNCSDIGHLANGKQFLELESESWKQAVLFVRLYHLIYDRFNGDEVAIYHWLRAKNQDINGIPLYLIVDFDQLANVVEYVLMLQENCGVGDKPRRGDHS